MPLLVACLAALALPLMVAAFPPLTDLPQHIAHTALLGRALADPGGPLEVNWFTPYALLYVIIGVLWQLVGSVAVPRATVLAVVALWVAALHLLAGVRGRPAAAAVAASVLLFNPVFYWGFLSFAIGWPCFAVWLWLTTRPPARRAGVEALLFFAGATLLYYSHALWFAAGMAWLLLRLAMHRPPLRREWPRLLGVVPVLALAALWYWSYSSALSGQFAPRWTALPTRRWSIDWLAEAIAGGLSGGLELAVFALLVGWIAFALRRAQRQQWRGVDRDLLLAAGLLLAFVLLLPNDYLFTILFADRFAPFAASLLLLALPAPFSHAGLGRAAAVAALVFVSSVTTVAWARYDRHETTGLDLALERLPARTRVLGLDFVKRSRFVEGFPFVHAYAHAQVRKDAELFLSFADYPNFPVTYRGGRPRPWTAGLHWVPQSVTTADLQQFDHAIVNADASVHERLRTTLALEPLTAEGRFRLYRLPGAGGE